MSFMNMDENQFTMSMFLSSALKVKTTNIINRSYFYWFNSLTLVQATEVWFVWSLLGLETWFDTELTYNDFMS